ncbi:MAG: diacylglycerol kinase family protein [Vicinamibacterales bacterium]
MKRATVIINPIAGPGRARTINACEDLARTTLAAHGFEANVRVTVGPDDSRRFAEEALRANEDLVIAWGGDGTINGAASALAHSKLPLAIIRGGSGNGLARDLGVPHDPAEAFRVAATGATRAIDAGEVGGSLFFNVAGIGLDARIAARLASPDHRRGLAGYVLATLAELPRYQPNGYSIRIGHESLETKAMFIAIANSRQYGNGAQIAPIARLDDGILELVVVQPQSGLRIALRIPAFFRGTLSERPGLVMRRGSELQIRGERPMSFHVDGEPRRGGEILSVRTHPRALLIKVQPA